ncbi:MULTISPECIES: hypothetical protein [unclassified Bradyrhizobium]|uniref:hypothetical protein n=1 Tax=unclassified Bradyrhizobium TaxID=2631580 RepID=UPI002916AE27|nr:MULTISPECIES: hypothetical protein [unclassified Bradyrhizobium]
MLDPIALRRLTKIRLVRLALRLVVLGALTPPGVLGSLVLAHAGAQPLATVAPAAAALGLGAALALALVR